MREKDFQTQVQQYAALRGFTMQYHTYNSRRSAPGYPDLCLVNPKEKRIIFAELKNETGKPSPEQKAWIEALDNCTVNAGIYRPQTWREIEEILR